MEALYKNEGAFVIHRTEQKLPQLLINKYLEFVKATKNT